MAVYKSLNDIIVSFIEVLRLTQASLDTKPGTVARDVFIDAPAQQLADLYAQLRNVANLSSLFTSNGNDLTKLASNFGISKISGSSATGTVVFTTNNMDVDIVIPSGTVVTALNGVSFKTLASYTMKSTSKNVYKATATRLRSDLDLASITDEYAIEINVEALVPGTVGNVGRFSVTSQNVSGISNITNLETFSGGTDQESDAEFRSRILSIFAGSNTGTSLGYETTVKANQYVEDAIVVVPGDPYMTRDGTETTTNSDGDVIVSDPGSGGKVDLYVLGSNLVSEIDSFIYTDQSGNNDPTDPDNDIILGQQGQDTTITAAQRRVTLLAEGEELPYQPVEEILSVVGSSSGSNFVEKYTDSDGSIKGNYELLKDTGAYGGSVFGFDKIHFISDEINLEDEDVTKGIFNGIDSLAFSDINKISKITQNILVTDENSTVGTIRSYITVDHTPITTVSRVSNLTTGERYTISDQNPDGTSGELNTTGKITISGSTLPTATDVLQVDYTWVKTFDDVLDFDNLYYSNPVRTAQDSVDWGFGNLVTKEQATVGDAYGPTSLLVEHPIYSIIKVYTFTSETATISDGSAVVSSSITDIISVIRNSDDAELYNTDAADGSTSGTSVILPEDTLAEDGDAVTIKYNTVDLYSPDAYDQGSYVDDTISLNEGIIDSGSEVYVDYIANINTLLPTTDLNSLPVSNSGNKLTVGGSVAGYQPTSGVYDDDDNIIQNLRRAASNLKCTVSNIGAAGTIYIKGITWHKVTDALVVATAGNGLILDLTKAIQSDLGVSSVPDDVMVCKLHSLERVNVNTSGSITSVDNVYDVVNYKLKNNTYDLEVALQDNTLETTEIELPETVNNEDALLETGDVLRVTFYYIYEDDSESLYFSKNGTMITDKVFAYVNRISITSGFLNASGSIAGNLTIYNLNQPVGNSTYNVDYNYTAPKENERITVTFNYNKLIGDLTSTIEDIRPITSDVLIKAATPVDIDVSVKIVLLEEYIESERTVIQDVTDSIAEFLNENSLGTTIDASDVINNIYTVSGIDRVQIIYFGTSSTGNVLSVTANKTQYLRAGTITVAAEER